MNREEGNYHKEGLIYSHPRKDTKTNLWRKECDRVLRLEGFIKSTMDECLYYNPDLPSFVAVHVDDMNVAAPTTLEIPQVKKNLSQHFVVTSKTTSLLAPFLVQLNLLLVKYTACRTASSHKVLGNPA